MAVRHNLPRQPAWQQSSRARSSTVDRTVTTKPAAMGSRPGRRCAPLRRGEPRGAGGGGATTASRRHRHGYRVRRTAALRCADTVCAVSLCAADTELGTRAEPQPAKSQAASETQRVVVVVVMGGGWWVVVVVGGGGGGGGRWYVGVYVFQKEGLNEWM